MKITKSIFLLFIIGALTACEQGFDRKKYEQEFFSKEASGDFTGSQEQNFFSEDDFFESTDFGEQQILNPLDEEDQNQSVSPEDLPQKNITMVTIGDSISDGFNAKGFGAHDSRYNWSSGEALTGTSGSHLYKIKTLATQIKRQISIRAYNYAAVGAEAIDTDDPPLSQQVTQALPRKADYVTIMIGANDICQTKLPLSTFKNLFQQRIESALQRFVGDQDPPELIYVSSIPNPRKLKSTQPSGFSFEGLKCRAAWEYACPNMQKRSAAAFDSYWKAANDVLESTSKRIGGPVIFDDMAVADASFSRSDVSSTDCFHPSVSGQRKISTTSWKAVSPYVEKMLRAP